MYDGVELLDLAGPGEVFAATVDAQGTRAFVLSTVAPSADTIMSQGFVQIVPEVAMAGTDLPDLLVVPGGETEMLRALPKAMRWIEEAARHARLVLTVCTGALVLADTGLLDGRAATTWHGALDRLRAQAPRTTIHTGCRVVDSGRIVTTAGVSAGIDGALHVVERLVSAEAASATARYMEYAWAPGQGLVVDDASSVPDS